jgi:hypothetical protein
MNKETGTLTVCYSQVAAVAVVTAVAATVPIVVAVVLMLRPRKNFIHVLASEYVLTTLFSEFRTAHL